MKKIRCIGFSISGRITAQSKMQELEIILRVLKRAGWGVIVPLQTAGERHIARFCNHHEIFCVGLFTSPLNAPEFRGALAREIDDYTKEEEGIVEGIYRSHGKSMSWEFMPADRRRLLTSTVPLVQYSYSMAIWPESTETSVAAAVAGIHRRRIFYLPQAMGQLTAHIVGGR